MSEQSVPEMSFKKALGILRGVYNEYTAVIMLNEVLEKASEAEAFIESAGKRSVEAADHAMAERRGELESLDLKIAERRERLAVIERELEGLRARLGG